MAERSDEQEIQAAAILYLLDIGEDELANVLLACRLTVEFWTHNGSFHYIEIAGRQPNLKKLRTPHGSGEILNRATYTALRKTLPRPIEIDNDEFDIKLQTALGATSSYQEEIRELIESAGVDEPAIGGLRVRREGHEYQLKPISIFPVGTFERDANLCFVLMPFAAGFQPIYQQGIRRAVESQGLTCQRGDDILQAGDIIGQIWSSLIQARLVIADLTGANGNVLYELGLAHMMGHQAILLAQDISSVPFDLRQQRHIIYSATENGIQKLTTDLAQAIQATRAQ